MWWLVALLVGYVAFRLYKYHLRHLQLLAIRDAFGGPKPTSYFLGTFRLLRKKGTADVIDSMIGLHERYGPDVAIIGAFNDLVLDLSSPQNVEKVLLCKYTRKSFAYSFLEPWVGSGLFLSVGERWLQRRKIITPTFHFKMLDQFIDVFNEQSDILVSKLEKHVGGAEFNVYDYVKLYTLDSICATSMGVQIHAQDDPNNEYLQLVEQMTGFFVRRVKSLLRQFPSLFFLYPFAWEQARVLKKVHGFTESIIETRRTQLERENRLGAVECEVNEEHLYSRRRHTFLDQLLHARIDGQPLDKVAVRVEVDTFLFAGHDTTTTTIALALLHLAQHQEVQQRLYEEIDRLLGDEKRTAPLTTASLQKFKYLDMVLKEVLRLFPAVPLIGRTLLKDMEMNGTTIPAGTTLVVKIFNIHRNPAVFPDPERFDPERFADTNAIPRGPFDYIPFSAGQRNCIGQKYAMLEMKVTIVKLLASYRILPDESPGRPRYKLDLVLRPATGVPVKLEKRL